MAKKTFSQAEQDAVWNKAFVQNNNDPNMFRKDYAGAWIRKSDYGNRDSEYGWEIDHLYPESLGGSDDLSNLMPLHWKNNVSKGDNYPRWTTSVSSDGVKNVDSVRNWKI